MMTGKAIAFSLLLSFGVVCPSRANFPLTVLDFEPNEPGTGNPNDGISDYTPTPWTIDENAANPSWWAKAGGETPFVTTSAMDGVSARSGNQKYAADPGAVEGVGAKIMAYNLNAPAGQPGPFFNSGHREFWLSWWVKNTAPGTDYAGRIGLWNNDTRFVGMAIGHPSVAGGRTFVLILSQSPDPLADTIMVDTHAENSIASEWTQVALRIGSEAEADSELFIFGFGLRISDLTGGPTIHAGDFPNIALQLAGARDAAGVQATSTTYFDRIVLGHSYEEVELGSEPLPKPVAVALAHNATTTEGFTNVLDGSLSSDHTRTMGSGTNLIYLWSQIAGSTNVLLSPNATNAVVTFVAPTVPSASSVSNDATLRFQLLVRDENSATETDEVDVRVFLKGDLNRNNTVNSVDLGQTRANFGRFLTP